MKKVAEFKVWDIDEQKYLETFSDVLNSKNYKIIMTKTFRIYFHRKSEFTVIPTISIAFEKSISNQGYYFDFEISFAFWFCGICSNY